MSAASKRAAGRATADLDRMAKHAQENPSVSCGRTIARGQPWFRLTCSLRQGHKGHCQ